MKNTTYTGPEATARLVSIKEKSFKIEFKGAFCHSCGFSDYFEDFIVFLEEYSLNAKIIEIKGIDDGAVVKFMVET